MQITSMNGTMFLGCSSRSTATRALSWLECGSRVAAHAETIPINLPIAPTLGCNGPPFLGYLKDRPKTSPTARPPR